MFTVHFVDIRSGWPQYLSILSKKDNKINVLNINDPKIRKAFTQSNSPAKKYSHVFSVAFLISGQENSEYLGSRSDGARFYCRPSATTWSLLLTDSNTRNRRDCSVRPAIYLFVSFWFCIYYIVSACITVKYALL